MKKYLPLFIILGIFFLCKAGNLSLRLSDTNNYFYTSYQLLQNHFLYKDIFFTNFPLFPYIGSLYFLLVHGNLTLFFFTTTIEVCAITTLLYSITVQKTKNVFLSTLTSLSYMFSFLVLSTSDHQTGVFTATLFVVLAYFFLQKNKLIPAGIFMGLSLMVKAYFLPIFLAVSCYLLYKKVYKQLFTFLTVTTGTIFLILLPFLLFAQKELLADVFFYSLTRSQGLIKSEIAWFFISHDVLFVILMIFSLVSFRKHILFTCITIFSVLFFAFYKDTYYLYLNFLPPFLSLLLPDFLQTLQKQLKLQTLTIPSLCIILLLINCFIYLQNFADLQKIDFHPLITKIKELHPKVLYGVNDSTQALAYETQTPLLADIIDTNENIFRKGLLSKDTLTKKAIEQHAVLITHGALYPTYGVNQPILDTIFDTKLVNKYCKLEVSVPVKAEGVTNRINLFSCL